MLNFGLIGAAGYIAARHFKAIKEIGGSLKVAIDTHDSIGLIDSFFPDSEFFKSTQDFSESKLQDLDYFTICTPNFLHKSHIEFAIEQGANVICEKPIVLTCQDALELQNLEKKSGKKISTILQLRLHPDIIALKNRVDSEISQNPSKKFQVNLSYITQRGNWYLKSWKGDEQKSGGLATNIGIHFFDMLIFLFGAVKNIELIFKSEKTMCGVLELENALVQWFLSIDSEFLPQSCKVQNKRTFRQISVDSEILEFSENFENLHTKSYEKILQNLGFGIEQALPSIEVVEKLRHLKAQTTTLDWRNFQNLKV